MYVIINLAVGGWISFPDKNTLSPAEMLVDYVRVWQESLFDFHRMPGPCSV